MSDPKMTTSALAGWFGSNRMLAETVGRKIGKCAHIVVPFAGGCCEVPYFDARTISINDVHRHTVNLARVVANPVQCQQLQNRVDALLFHPDELASAQILCKEVESRESREAVGLFGSSGGDRHIDRVHRLIAAGRSHRGPLILRGRLIRIGLSRAGQFPPLLAAELAVLLQRTARHEPVCQPERRQQLVLIPGYFAHQSAGRHISEAAGRQHAGGRADILEVDRRLRLGAGGQVSCWMARGRDNSLSRY